jgi:hypothetical protein
MSGQSTDGSERERRPNGHPFLDSDRAKLSQLETGDFYLSLCDEDGDWFQVNLTSDQFSAFVDMVNDIDKRSIDTDTDRSGGDAR